VSYPERIVPDDVEPGIAALHLKRYVFAEPYCAGKEVLDACCGVGYGSAHLAATAARVVGVDVSSEAIEYARTRYGAPNVDFAAMDVTSLAFEGDSFDVVVAFEAIEHVRDATAFLREMTRVLRPHGALLVSTPQARSTTRQPDNPFHTVEYSRADFASLLERHFGEVVLYGQRRPETRRHRFLRRLDVLGLRRRLSLGRRTAALVGTAPTAAATLDDIVIEQTQLESATELVAVCRLPTPSAKVSQGNTRSGTG
jgi:2-polyprenyl-3-methyl-5-hydroxy-6-metoxy-1,4-benzoquinol methylase